MPCNRIFCCADHVYIPVLVDHRFRPSGFSRLDSLPCWPPCAPLDTNRPQRSSGSLSCPPVVPVALSGFSVPVQVFAGWCFRQSAIPAQLSTGLPPTHDMLVNDRCVGHIFECGTDCRVQRPEGARSGAGGADGGGPCVDTGYNLTQ